MGPESIYSPNPNPMTQFDVDFGGFDFRFPKYSFYSMMFRRGELVEQASKPRLKGELGYMPLRRAQPSYSRQNSKRKEMMFNVHQVKVVSWGLGP